jgi:hypothetical protein
MVQNALKSGAADSFFFLRKKDGGDKNSCNAGVKTAKIQQKQLPYSGICPLRKELYLRLSEKRPFLRAPITTLPYVFMEQDRPTHSARLN